MSRTYRQGDKPIVVHGARKDPADLRRLARALIALAQAQAEADAQGLAEDRAVRKNNVKMTGKTKVTGILGDASPPTTDRGDAA